jgi:membrane protease YdiL (CAAX protease family)
MKTIKAFIKSHPLLSYFALAFTLSWGAVLIVVGPNGFLGTKEIPEVLEPFLYVTMVLGPSVAGLFALSLTSPVYLPGIFITDDKTTVLLSGIAGGLVAGIFEELGWTGFAGLLRNLLDAITAFPTQ